MIALRHLILVVVLIGLSAPGWRSALAQAPVAQAPLAATGGPSGELPPLKPFHLRLFEIPYDWTGGSRPHNVAAVKLYVSSDRGATWQEISTAKPEVEYFRYHAPHDGEFWFAIRTIDRLGRARPEGPMRPEQRMLIDTTNPEIVRFDAWYSTPGKITASWQAVDTQIDLQHTTIEYRLPSGDWQLAPTAGGYIERPGCAMGEATWAVDGSVEEVQLRLTVRDMVGNGRQAGAEARPGTPPGQLASDLPPNATPQPGTTLPPPPGFAWSGGSGNVPQAAPHAPWHQGHLTQNAPPAQGEIWPADGTSSVPLGSPAGKPYGESPVGPPPVAFNPQPGAVTHQPPAWTSPFQHPQQVPSGTGTGATPAHTASSRIAPPPTSPQGLPQQWPPVNGPPGVETAGQIPSGQFQALAPPPPLTSENRSDIANSHGVRIDQYLNQLHVDFDYDVVAGGPYGLARVELWSTSDQGREWTRIAIDNDNRSPIKGNFPGPGLYGLRIVVEPTGGLEAVRPRPGDQPEMYIAIDTQAPQARLTRVRQGEGYFADHLMVSWETSDENLPENAAVLYFSASRDGPWQTVANNLTNSGQFAWRLARHVPPEFYLRLETIDLAGNKASDQTAVPVKIVLPTASGQLQHARPAGQ